MELSTDLPATLIFNYPTINAIAAHMDALGSRVSKMTTIRTKMNVYLKSFSCIGNILIVDTCFEPQQVCHFTELVIRGYDAYSTAPHSRWDPLVSPIANYGAFSLCPTRHTVPIGMSRVEALSMDPCCLSLLEMSDAVL